MTTAAASDINSAKQVMIAFLEEQFANVAFRRGAVHDLVVVPCAYVLASAVNPRLAELEASSNIRRILENPNSVSPQLAESVFANYGVVPRQPQVASGAIVLRATSSDPLVLPLATKFTANGITFSIVESILIRPPGATLVSDSERAWVADGALFRSMIPVVADVPGSVGMLTYGTAVQPTLPIAKFHSAIVLDDFVGGYAGESITSLRSRLLDSMSSNTIVNLLRQDARIMAYSIIGATDSEMQRNKQGAFPIAVPGYMDVYIRTSHDVIYKSVEMIGVRDGVDHVGVISAEDASGFYHVSAVSCAGVACSVVSIETIASPRGDDPLPLLPDTNAMYGTAHQTLSIRFNIPASVEDTVTATATLIFMPYIAEIQDAISDRAVRYPGLDVIARAAIPCLVSVSFRIRTPTTIDTSAITNTIVETINGLAIGDRLTSSPLIAKIQQMLPSAASILGFELSGRFLLPNGQSILVRDRDEIAVPTDTDFVMSVRTVMFCAAASRVNIEIGG